MFIICLLVFIATVTGVTIMRENWLFFLFGLKKKTNKKSSEDCSNKITRYSNFELSVKHFHDYFC